MTAEAPIDPSDDFAPGMLFILLAALCIALILIGVGIVVAGIIAASVAVLAGLGIVSSAVLIGMLRRRFSSGLRAMHYQFCTVVAIPAGIGILWLGSYLTHSELSPRETLTIGSLAGACGGLAFAFLFDLVISAVYRRFAAPVIAANSGSVNSHQEP